MTRLQRRLRAAKLDLPAPPQPGGAYESVAVRGDVAYVAIQFPILDGEHLHRGRLGAEVTAEEGYAAVRLCTLNVLAQLAEKLGDRELLGFNHLDLSYVAAPGWDDAPRVADAAGELLREVLGEAGRHTRSLRGVAHLPRDFCVGLAATATLLPPPALRPKRPGIFTRRTRR